MLQEKREGRGRMSARRSFNCVADYVIFALLDFCGAKEIVGRSKAEQRVYPRFSCIRGK